MDALRKAFHLQQPIIWMTNKIVTRPQQSRFHLAYSEHKGFESELIFRIHLRLQVPDVENLTCQQRNHGVEK